MKQLFTLLFVLLSLQTLMAQNTGFKTSRTLETTMTLEGRVLNEDGTPISGANVEGKMGRYATTDALGRFKLPVNMGEEIVIRGLDFETVYYRIRSNEDIEIRVQNPEQDTKKLSTLSYKIAMDSAQFYLQTDAQKTADFLIAALSNDPKSLSTTQESAAYEKLGDLYTFNKQYDLAIDNYTQAETLEKSFNITIKKADALRLNGNYQEAITAYKINPNKKSSALSITEQLARLNGLADAYSKTNNETKALETYKKALFIATAANNKSEMTSINTNIARIYNSLGELDDAESFYNTAIQESKKESTTANVVTQSRTADFYNSNAQFDKEIALRRSNIQLLDEIAADKKRVQRKPDSIATDQKAGFLNSPKIMAESESVSSEYEMEEIVMDSPVETTSITPTMENTNLGLTKQKEQLKIAEALKSQNKISEAISFFEASLEEATVNNDLAIKKDAAKSLYELNKKAGNTIKALSYNELYINTVDALYLEKENELEETARKAKELVSKQTRILTLEKDRELTENKIALINTERELTQEMNQRQRWVIYSLVALSLLLLTLAYFMYRNNKQQKINNHLLALKSLRSQMNPHFIFNALNSVNNYIAQNDERAAN
ncbi:MAG: histidine kinase, partial [Nonlabens sp.]